MKSTFFVFAKRGQTKRRRFFHKEQTMSEICLVRLKHARKMQNITYQRLSQSLAVVSARHKLHNKLITSALQNTLIVTSRSANVKTYRSDNSKRWLQHA